MAKIIIGCDPDVDGKGFAFYEDGALNEIDAYTLIDLTIRIELITSVFPFDDIELHIEDVIANSSSQFNWIRLPAKDKKKQDAINAKISEKVGRCKQAQLEVEKIAGHFDIKIVRHKVSSKWKDAAGKKEFKLATGWKGQSNPDTRSAAYFGFLGCK
jgi:hypothetical protein